MNLFELEAFVRRLGEFEAALIRSGQPKKYLLDVKSVRTCAQKMIDAERKRNG